MEYVKRSVSPSIQPLWVLLPSYPFFTNKTHIIQFLTSPGHLMSFCCHLPKVWADQNNSTDFERNCLMTWVQIREHLAWKIPPHLKIRTICYHKDTLLWVEQQTQVAMSFSGFLMDASPPQHPNLRPSCHHCWGLGRILSCPNQPISITFKDHQTYNLF